MKGFYHLVCDGSHNQCSYEIETRDNKCAVSAEWLTKPTEADRAELRASVMEVMAGKVGPDTVVTHGNDGAISDGGRERQRQTIKRFLETGKGSNN